MLNDNKDWKDQKLPDCFVPCPQFYDICNRGAAVIVEPANPDYKKCTECYNKHNLVDYIE